MSERALRRRAREARAWLFDACFPLWAEYGLEGAGFREALDLQHRPVEAGLARVRVQARQTYVFAEAVALGWQAARAGELVETGVRVLDTLCRRSDGLFVRKVDLVNGTRDGDEADLYDTAFALYALARARRVCGPLEAADRLIDEALAGIDAVLIDPTGGYAEAAPRPALRGQNPHMHLFEACLALAEGPEPEPERYLVRAAGLQALCLKRFIDVETGTLGEFFEPGSWARPDGEPGESVEPGHHFEWVWLLNRYAQMTDGPLPEIAHRLYDFACGTLDAEGRAIQSCTRDGTPVDASRRTWPQTEALKAHLAVWQAGDGAAGARAVASFDILMDEYLTVDGGWIDRYAGNGEVVARDMPASTGYHVVLAFADLIGAVEA